VVNLFVLGDVLNYATLRAEFTNELLVAVHETILVKEFLVASLHISVVLASGNLMISVMAMIHACPNVGFPVSDPLGGSIGYGEIIWTFGPPIKSTNSYLDTVSA